MTHILESIIVNASPQQIWEYVQEYRQRAEWDVTTLRFEPLDMERVDKDVRVFVRRRAGWSMKACMSVSNPIGSRP